MKMPLQAAHRLGLTVLLMAGGIFPGFAADLTVGEGKTFALPSEAARAAQAGDVIKIFPGTYPDCARLDAHGIYAGHIALLRVENCTFEEQHVGHHIKSRAARTEVIHNSIQDGPDGSASYLVDLPNGGSALISGNIFEKGPRSSNKKTAIA